MLLLIMKTLPALTTLFLMFLAPYSAHAKTDTKPYVSHQTEFVCGAKKKCSQMTSCKEAYFYLNKCGLKRLDRDKDGIPCESICN
jgi:hypothetical protein